MRIDRVAGTSVGKPDTEHLPARRGWLNWPTGSIRGVHGKTLVFAAAVAVHIAIFPSLFFGYLNPLFHDTQGGISQGVDFFAIYRAGALLLDGHSIYGIHWDSIGGEPYGSPYRYLPFFAETAGVGLASLPAWTAYWLWVSLIEVMLFANVWLTLRIVRDDRWRWICASMWLVYTPLYVELWMGQFSFLMATLALWTAAPLLRGANGRAGAPWIVSVLIKSHSGLLLPMFARLRQWRPLVLLAAALVAFNLPYFIAFPDDARLFWHENFAMQLNPGDLPPALRASGDYGLPSLVRMTWFAFRADDAGLPPGMMAVVAVAIVGATLVATFAPRTMDVVATFAAWWAVYFLVYLAWEHSYVVMLPALVLLAGLRPQYRTAAVIAFVVLALPTPYFVLDRAYGVDPTGFTFNRDIAWPGWAVVVQHAWKPVPILGLWAFVCGGEILRGYRERLAQGRSAPSFERLPERGLVTHGLQVSLVRLARSRRQCALAQRDDARTE